MLGVLMRIEATHSLTAELKKLRCHPEQHAELTAITILQAG